MQSVNRRGNKVEILILLWAWWFGLLRASISLLGDSKRQSYNRSTSKNPCVQEVSTEVCLGLGWVPIMADPNLVLRVVILSE